MALYFLYLVLVAIFVSKIGNGQVLQFGLCPEVETMRYFDLERFLGEWYEVARFPTWYEDYGACAYKKIQYCGRRVEIEHVFVRHGIQFVLHVNSSYVPGDEAVFAIQESNIDPVGIPLKVIATDYKNYAVVYGCRNKTEMDLKYTQAWILSRAPVLQEDMLDKAYMELNLVPGASVAFLETVEQRREKCFFHWTAHVQAVNNIDSSGDDSEENK